MTERYQQGLRTLKTIFGDTGMTVVDSIAETSPDFARMYVEVPFTDIYSRGVLDNKTRELLAIAALTSLGNAEPQLESHIRGALHVGCSTGEIIEAIIQMSVFAGFPRTINSLTVARKIFAQ